MKPDQHHSSYGLREAKHRIAERARRSRDLIEYIPPTRPSQPALPQTPFTNEWLAANDLHAALMVGAKMLVYIEQLEARVHRADDDLLAA